MTPTERAKRSDALYYETVSVNRRVLCDMVANREADLEDAKAENEHMRLKALAVMGELQEESERLKAENARLREYAKLMHGHIKDSCNVCDEYYCSSWDEDNECCVFDSYMRELGVIK